MDTVGYPGTEPGLVFLLMLTDGRFPAGGHAHSGGLEAAVAAGRVVDLPSLRAFLTGRLATTGRLDAAFAAAACAGADSLLLDAELDARIPSPALRLASRRQGRALARAAGAVWPAPDLERAAVPGSPGGRPPGPHLAVALGLTAAAAGLSPAQAAAAAYGAVTGPASASVRLLGLDPYAVQRVLARLGPDCERTAAAAARDAHGPVDALPAPGAPLLDIAAEDHATWEVRLFAS